MGKAEKGTPKWLANKMKSKGLQKLRWYCQMCQKQCRDENGFKCHTQSEAHQRQLLLFADNPHRFLNDYSAEFERDFLHLLKRCHGTKRIKANLVYQEYIGHKEHVHMNATRWETLTGMVQYLGRTGKCHVDQTEEGWFIAWIDRDPETIARQEALAKKDKLEQDDDERLAKFIEGQVARAQTAEDPAQPRFTELQRADPDQKLQLGLTLQEKRGAETRLNQAPSVFRTASGLRSERSARPSGESQRKKSALAEIMEEEARHKRRRNPDTEPSTPKPPASVRDHWLRKDIVVKIVTDSLGPKYHKQKGYVREVIDRYTAVVVLFQMDKKIKLDQTHLETVIPAEGKSVLVLNGPHRGQLGQLKSIDVDSYSAYVTLQSTGEHVKLPYEHFSKFCGGDA
eukprot:snap_masked-scaffold188_size271682-processed-gene-1.13 protein:Tk00148 transcript:snap_masked-scaffold188_size271682-processed-gene-1.13-mRNA-1 annotation:"antigenic determinant of reca protein homolog"